MQFNGFSEETGEFLWGIAFNNEKPWFEAHREQFVRAVKEPLDALAREVLALTEAKHPDDGYRVHISRIHRDARRLFGRGPYKDHLWFTLWSNAGDDNGPAFWFEVGPATYSYGVGFYCAKPGQMDAFRRYVDANPAETERLVKRVARAGYTLDGEEYKRPKKDVGPVLNPWYNRKFLALSKTFDHGGEFYTAELPAVLAASYEELMPVYELMCRFVTP